MMRFGYCCIALGVPDCSTARTITVKNLEKIDPAHRWGRLANIARANLENSRRLVWYNQAHAIGLYRFSSQLVPLATHPITAGWDYRTELRLELLAVGQAVNETGLRVSTHPGQYTVLNTPSEAVWQNALADLEYHHQVLSAMELRQNARMIVHVGGAYHNKTQALDRFKRRFAEIPAAIRDRICIENDDRVFTVRDVLGLAQSLAVPMVVDVHHHRYCNQGEDLREYLPAIFATWGDERPKIHLSSPKSEQDCRAHADWVAPQDFRNFHAITPTAEVDVMVEAKMKDLAVFKLREVLEL